MADVGTEKEFEIKHRPRDFRNFFPSVDVSKFQEMVDKDKYPQKITLYGQPGLGKTTAAHILASYILKLDKESSESLISETKHIAVPNFREADFATNPSAEYTSQIADDMAAAISDGGLFGKVRYVFLLDEFTQLRPETQKRLIKLIADHALDNVYVIITTNDISKVEGSFDDRMQNIRFTRPGEVSGIEYIQTIAKKEKVQLTKDEARRIYHTSTGSYRSMMLNLWSYLTYGRTMDDAGIDESNEPVKRYFTALTEVFEEVWRVESTAQAAGAIINYKDVTDVRYNGLISAIETLALTKKSNRAVYEALAAFIMFVLRKPDSKYDNLALGYDLMKEIDKLRTTYDGNPAYELLKISEAAIRARIEKRFHVHRFAPIIRPTQT